MSEVIFSILFFVIIFCFFTVRNHQVPVDLISKTKIDF